MGEGKRWFLWAQVLAAQFISLKFEHLSNRTTSAWLEVSKTIALIFKFRFFSFFFIPKNTPSLVKFTAISVERKWHSKYKKITQEKCSKSIFQRIIYTHRASVCVRFFSTELIIVFWLFRVHVLDHMS